jgi:hypothetical protein
VAFPCGTGLAGPGLSASRSTAAGCCFGFPFCALASVDRPAMQRAVVITQTPGVRSLRIVVLLLMASRVESRGVPEAAGSGMNRRGAVGFEWSLARMPFVESSTQIRKSRGGSREGHRETSTMFRRYYANATRRRPRWYGPQFYLVKVKRPQRKWLERPRSLVRPGEVFAAKPQSHQKSGKGDS